MADDTSSPVVAVLGTGTMGEPMARNMLAADLRVRAWNRTTEKAEPLGDAGAEVCDSAAEAVTGAQLVVTMLADGDSVLEAVDAGAALAGAADGAIWIQMSTVGVDACRRCEQIAREAGITFVDAPVLGTAQPARDGALVVLASGPEQELRGRCEPVFDAVGQKTLWVGEAGAATRLKLVTNAWLLSVVAGLAETFALAEALDVDPQRFLDAIEGGALDVPYAKVKGKLIMERDFEPPSFKLRHAAKDARLMLAAAGAADLQPAVLERIAEQFERAIEAGHGDEDLQALYWLSAPPGAAPA